jgi:hypothetical protein
VSDSNIDFSKPLQTTDGDPVTILSTNGREPFPIVGYIGASNTPATWTSTGKFSLIEDAVPGRDLVNATEKRYVVMFRSGNGVVAGAYKTKGQAGNAVEDMVRNLYGKYLGTVEVDWG